MKLGGRKYTRTRVLNFPFMQNGYALLHNSAPPPPIHPTSIKNLINAPMPRRD